MEDLFSMGAKKLAPLADRMRPRTLDEFMGQKQIVGEGKLLRRAIEADRLTSSIFWGPPGTGKTTLASIVAETTNAAFEKMNAVTSGVSDVREVLQRAENRLKLQGQTTYLLLDECHRWSKAQSDSILPAIEKGVIRFIGSTTENPMIAMTPAIVSRCRLFRFEPLSEEDVIEAIHRAIRDEERGFGLQYVSIDDEAAKRIAQAASGDVRSALNALEIAVLSTPVSRKGEIHITPEIADDSIQTPTLRMDESLFYDMLSAFCKSLRGSDPDAALAWFARLDHAGVDPRIIVRRVIAHASEDVGIANNVTLEIHDGRIIGSDSRIVSEYISKLPSEDSTVCELGLGMNTNVTGLCGYTVLDEKMAHSFHIAIGANLMFGGQNDSKVHTDFVNAGPFELIPES